MSNIDKQELRADALEATGGSWVRESGEGWEAICCDDDQGNAGFIIAEFQGENATANRKFVQSANPATVLALLDELEAKDRRVAELEVSHGKLREAMSGIHNTISGEGAYTPLAAILNASKRAYEESAAAAGKGEAS
ncbi:TPA: ead/Ea22-like family protein [Enterobacter roggenkampii]